MGKLVTPALIRENSSMGVEVKASAILAPTVGRSVTGRISSAESPSEKAAECDFPDGQAAITFGKGRRCQFEDFVAANP